MEENEDILNAPPFPPLKWDDFAFWEGEAVLPSWPDYLVRADLGPVRLHVWAEGEKYPPTVEQIAAFRYLLDNGKIIADTVTHKALHECPLERIDEPLTLGRMCIHEVSKEGVAYVCLEFEVSKEGVAFVVMMHRDRVVEFGSADLIFEAWIARQDARGE